MRLALFMILISTGFLLILSPLAIPVLSSYSEFGIASERWDGCSEFGELLQSKKIVIPIYTSIDNFQLSRRTGTLLILGPSLEYTDSELKEIRDFLSRGNVVILADDFGTGNDVLGERGLNLSVRFERKLYEDLFFYRNSHFPVAIKITDPDLARGVTMIILNNPSYLFIDKGIMYTSSVSIVKRNVGERVIMAELPYLKGRIVLISDPSIFINEMYKLNEPFLRNLVEMIPGNVVYVDESHHLGFNFYQFAFLGLKRYLTEKFLIILITSSILIAFGNELGIFSLILSIFSRREMSNLSPDDALAELVEEGYDEEMLNFIVKEWNIGRELLDVIGGWRISPKD